MRILELFSGTGSIGKVWELHGHEVVSVDSDNTFKPTHHTNILDFDYQQLGDFDYIHASPPCCAYSKLQQSWYGREKIIGGKRVLFTEDLHKQQLETSDKLVLKALEIIDFFKPPCWTIENPYSKCKYNLTSRKIMAGIPHTICNYCMYGHPVQKATGFFNNFGLELLTCTKDHKHKRWGTGDTTTLPRPYCRYVIPEALCEVIYQSVTELNDQ